MEQYPRYARYHVRDFVCLPHTHWPVPAENQGEAVEWMLEYSKTSSLPIVLYLEYDKTSSGLIAFFWHGQQYTDYQREWFSDYVPAPPAGDESAGAK